MLVSLLHVHLTKTQIGCHVARAGVPGYRRGDVDRVIVKDLVLRECDVSVRLSRGAALITRWLDAES